ncbi:MAG: thioredoxin family protein [Bacteroidota bacterium]
MTRYRILWSLLFIVSFTYTTTQAQVNDTSLLIGTIEYKNLTTYSWFDSTFKAYVPDVSIIDSIHPFAKDIRIMVVLGTWCGDSKEQVPALCKIAAKSGIDIHQIEFIGVDRKKHCPLPDITSLNIEYVPTIFVFVKGVLKGKIVEEPEKRLEQDILKLIIQ